VTRVANCYTPITFTFKLGKLPLKLSLACAGRKWQSIRARERYAVDEEKFVDVAHLYRDESYLSQSIDLLKAKGPNGHLHRSRIHDVKYINTHKHILF